MKNFTLKIFQFFVFSVVICTLIIVTWSYSHNISLKRIPAPKLSDSFSLNEKLRFIKGKNISTLSIGSSMTLCNLNSEKTVKYFKDDNYLNAGAWGLNMNEIFELVKLLNNNSNIKNIVISSNICDFFAIDKIIDYQSIDIYLNSSFSFFYYLKKFDLKYVISNYPYLTNAKKDLLNYESLVYDDHGAIKFSNANFKYNKERWENPYMGTPLESNYFALRKIIKFSNDNHIKLFFFQSPVREGLWKGSVISNLMKHQKKLEQIFNDKKNVYFVSSLNKKWEDNLFVDGTHLNEDGAKLFTNYCFSKLKDE